MNDPKHTDGQTPDGDELANLPDQQVSADDAEAVKGGIVVQGGLTAISPISTTSIKIDSTISTTAISPTIDSSLTLQKW